ncbi:MAG: flagellar filament capping protein FliD [Pirellulaceae bacterium]|nr:flagellar filament capping protein FliD [Pirellulaceae bacterium]MDP7014978.1 flagellar filament capping protein FliD [Pirellulaceae bacterium]
MSAPETPSLGDVIRKINEVDADKLVARISSGGDRLELEDKTSGANTFSVTSAFSGSTAEDLGLTGSPSGGVISSRRLHGGLKSVLLASLNGGSGLGSLGLLSLTDRDGDSANVDLSAAETLDDVLAAINGVGGNVDIRAEINRARNGVNLIDSSGGTGNLIITNGDATNTADALQLATNSATSTANSGSLDLKIFFEHLEISTLNNGQGVDDSSFVITDSSGASAAVNIAVSGAETIGDVIDEINKLSIGVEARINDSGDGLLLVDTAGGGNSLTVVDSGSGTAAQDLGIAGTSEEIVLGGQPTKVINGSTTVRIELDSDDTLDDLVQALNDANINVTASVFNEGSGTKPFRLSLTSNTPGRDGELQVDASSLGFDLFEVAKAQDALLLVGNDTTGGGILASSTTNTFDGVLEGVSLTVAGESEDPIEITVKTTDDTIVSNANAFVDQYNRLVDKIAEVTFFDEFNQSTGVLFGSSAVLRVQNSLSSLVTSPFFGVGKIRSLAELGFGVDAKGKLSVDTDALSDKFESDPDAVRQFFSTETTGFAAKVGAAIDSIAGEGNSLLVNRNNALQAKIDDNVQRIEFLSERLDRERDRLLVEFFTLEETIARLQNNLTAINSIQAIAPLVSVN